MTVFSTPRGRWRPIIGMCAMMASLLGGAIVVTNAQGPPPGQNSAFGGGPGGPGGPGGGHGGWGAAHAARMAAMAKDLGVPVQKLMDAMRMTRPAQRPMGPPTDAERTARQHQLAIVLGLPFSKVQTVMQKYPPRGFGGPGGPGGPGGMPDVAAREQRMASMAKDLGVPVAKLDAAMMKYHHPFTPGVRPTDAQREAEHKQIAVAIGVSTAKLDKVMDKYRPQHGGFGGPGGPGGPPPPQPQHPQLF